MSVVVQSDKIRELDNFVAKRASQWWKVIREFKDNVAQTGEDRISIEYAIRWNAEKTIEAEYLHSQASGLLRWLQKNPLEGTVETNLKMTIAELEREFLESQPWSQSCTCPMTNVVRLYTTKAKQRWLKFLGECLTIMRGE